MATRKKHNRAPNSGSISINKSGSVRAQITLPGGKRVTQSFPTKRAAENWLREMRNQIDAGLTTINHDILLSDFIHDWLIRKKTQIRDRTLTDYTHYCNDMISLHLGMLKLREIKLHTVNNFYVALMNGGRPVYVVRYIHRVLHSLFADAVRLGFIPANPSQYADVPIVEDAPDKMQIFSPSEHQTFVEACSSAVYGVLYQLGIKTGMRQGELLGLTWKNVDLEQCEIHVVQQLIRQKQKGQRLVFGPLKTKYSRRTIKIGSDLVELLKAYCVSQQKYKQLMGTNWKEHDLVFTSSVGTPLDQRNVQRDFDDLLKTAGLAKIRFHDLRHNAASLMLGRRVPVVTVSRYLGHSSSRVTLEVYAHLIPGGFDEVAQAMSAIPVSIDAA